MEKIKVAHILNSINLGGGARAVRTMYKYSPKNLEIHVITVFEKGEKYDEFSEICKNLYFAKGSVENVKKYIKKNNISILHFHSRGVFTDFELQLAQSLRPNCKIVCTNIFGEFCEKTDKLVDYYIFKSFHAFTQKFAPLAKINLKDKNLSNRYYVIPNPVDIDLFNSLKPSKKEILSLKKKLGIKPGDFVIGKIGSRKAIEKWSDLLLYMFSYLLKKYPNTVMLLQGVPDSRLGWIKKFNEKIKVIENTNSDNELALYYNLIDVFTHASKIGEHSGNSINEAMFWKKPVIVNLTPKKDNGQIEQVEHGVNGYFASSPELYSECVVKLVTDKKLSSRFGIKSHKNILKNNNPNEFVKLSQNIYKNLLMGDSVDLDFEQKVKDYTKDYQNILNKYYNEEVFSFNKFYWKIYDFIYHRFLTK